MTAHTIVKVDHDVNDVRSLVQFRNQDKPCMVIHADKAASDAEGLREAASMIDGTDRGKEVRAWLIDLAGKFENVGKPDV